MATTIKAPNLTQAELAALPVERSPLVRYGLPWLAVVVLAAWHVSLGEFRDTLTSDRLVDLVWLAGGLLPAVLMFPFLDRVGLRRWLAVVLTLVVPFAAMVFTWIVVFRMLSLPYRSWPIRPADMPRARKVPGTPDYVLLPLEPATAER